MSASLRRVVLSPARLRLDLADGSTLVMGFRASCPRVERSTRACARRSSGASATAGACPSLASALAQIGREAGYLERVVLRVSPLGREARAWAAEVAAMYLARAGARDLEAATSERDDRVGGRIEGQALRTILRGEAGLHRLAGAGRERLAIVCRVALASEEGADGDGVARVYRRGRPPARGARPRTGVRLPDSDAVLAGVIDDVLLAGR